MHAAVPRPRPHRQHHVNQFTSAFRSNAIGVGRVIHTARGNVLRAAHVKKWRLNSQKLRAALIHLQQDLQSTQHEVEAEVGEFIQSPHLLFRPIRMAVTLALPMVVPLFFMPTKVLFAYAVLVIAWYLLCLLFFATEVAMRPPWYKKGLPSKELPPYWKGFVHNPKIDLGAHYDDVEFPSPSGAILRGWYIPAPIHTQQAHTRRMIVFVHGAGRDRRTFLRHAAIFLERGYACLLFDFSEHGLSDGICPDVSRGTLFGAREQYDVVAAVNYLKNIHGASQVAIVGTSCGASSAILASAMCSGLCACVVAENPFTRADDLLRHHLDTLSQNYLSQNSHQTVRRAVFWLAGKVLMVRMGYYIQSFGAIDAVSKLTCPLLVAHSTEDDIVPYEHGREIYKTALKAKEGMEGMAAFLKFNDAAHCALYDKDPALWTSTVLTFVEKAFERQT